MDSLKTPFRAARLIGFFVGILALVGCGDKSTNPNNDTGPKTPITYPLAIGNRWTYSVQMVQGGTQDTLSRYDEILRTESIGGETYYTIKVSFSNLSPADSTFIRQTGQELHLIYAPSIPVQGDEAAWIMRRIRSNPWKVADFTGATGRIYQYGPVDTTFVTGVTAELTFVTTNLGRTSVTTPSGAYADVYKGRVTVLTTFQFETVMVGQLTVTDDLYIKDAVGLVQEVQETRVQATGQQDQVETVTSLLRSTHF